MKKEVNNCKKTICKNIKKINYKIGMKKKYKSETALLT